MWFNNKNNQHALIITKLCASMVLVPLENLSPRLLKAPNIGQGTSLIGR